MKSAQAFETAAVHVLGPTLDGFVLWVLQNAVKSGRKRLYFLARDGYLMYLAAKIYVERLSLPMECRYLSCSRYSLRLPAFHLEPEEAMEYLCRSSISVDLAKIMDRAGLDAKDRANVLADIRMTGRENEPISYAELNTVRKMLAESAVFREAMVRHSKDAYPAASGYLSQEGLLDGVPDALVDSGWVGSMQKTLGQLLRQMGRKEKIEGYYFGLYELPPDVEEDDYHCYYFSPRGQLREKVHFNNNLFEAVFSAPHGMTLGYRQSGERYEPVCAPVTSKRRRRMETLKSTLTAYIEETSSAVTEIESVDCKKRKRLLKKLLGMFMSAPTPAEAQAYGNIPFCDDVLEHDSRPLAEEMDENDLRSNHVLNKILVMTGMRKGKVRESAWFEGSAVRYSERPGYHLFQYKIYKYLLYIRQMYLWRKNNVKKNEESSPN